MPPYPPPKDFTPDPHLFTLRRGTRLWRVHRQCYEPGAFNTRPSDDNFDGGRFDGTETHPYSFLYAGLNAPTALHESFLRGLRFDDKGVRQIVRSQVADRCASALRVRQDLTLVSLLTDEALTAIAQDQWLINAAAAEYHMTRRWAGWIRDQVPTAAGLAWPSLRRLGNTSIVLFGDRCDPTDTLFDAGTRVDLTGDTGARWINRLLAPARARIPLPLDLPLD
jgi:hypothetical protein